MKKEENHSTSISLQSKCASETFLYTNDYLHFCVAYGGHAKTRHKVYISFCVLYNRDDGQFYNCVVNLQVLLLCSSYIMSESICRDLRKCSSSQ